MYTTVRKVLEEYGLEGTTWNNLLETTNLSSEQLYQTIGQGLRIGATETYTKNGIKYYRIRPKGKKLYSRKYKL